jgi:hypothetical protein
MPNLTGQLGARLLAAALALVAALIFMGVPDLATLPGWVDQAFEWPVPLEVSWGSLFTFFLAGGYVWVAIVPQRPEPGLVQVAIASVALAFSAAAGSDVRPLWVAAVAALSALALATMTQRSGAAGYSSWSVNGWQLALAAAGMFLWLPYTIEALEASRAGVVGDVTNGIEHWPVQGAMGGALILGSLLLAVWDVGRAVLRVTCCLSAAFIGMAQLAFPDRDGAMESELWGIGVVLWAVLLALAPAHPSPSRR